jgi:hypothetical protein
VSPDEEDTVDRAAGASSPARALAIATCWKNSTFGSDSGVVRMIGMLILLRFTALADYYARA